MTGPADYKRDRHDELKTFLLFVVTAIAEFRSAISPTCVLSAGRVEQPEKGL
jgi:hypothetical protein